MTTLGSRGRKEGTQRTQVATMTARLKGRGAKLALVEDVTQKIVDAIEGGYAVAYAPAKWQLIMWVIRHMPGAVFNKINI